MKRREGNRYLRWLRALVFWLLVLIGAIFVGSGLWVRQTFGDISVDQLLSNLEGAGGEGAGGADLVRNGVIMGIVLPVLVVIASIVGSYLWRLHRERKELHWRGFPKRGTAGLIAAVVAVSGVVSFGVVIGFNDYAQSWLRNFSDASDLGDYYTTPGMKASLSGFGMSAATKGIHGAEDPKNLVIVYLESIEDAFADDEMFEKNMLEPIQEATEGWESIPSLRQYEGGGWTMSGIVSTQCGIPLRNGVATADPMELNELDGTEAYLPGAECLGDVLAMQGHRNVFMGGADQSFAGKGSFMRGHGYDEVDDLAVWREQGETETRDDWGLSDRRLFELAEEKVAELHEANAPFTLTILSLDTHEPAWLHDYCEQDTDEPLTSVTYCSMEQAAGFIEYLDEEGILDDTVVVVMGDHLKELATWNSYYDQMIDLEGRTIFNRIWSPDGLSVERDDIDQFSMYPTILELIGIEIEDHRAGVGVSALTDEIPRGSMLELSETEYDLVVSSRSTELYDALWGSSPSD